VKARVGDWFTFRVADGRFAAARIGAVARRGRSYTGWFFGPFDARRRDVGQLAGARAAVRVRRSRPLGPVMSPERPFERHA
jgi:hypothetical protein